MLSPIRPSERKHPRSSRRRTLLFVAGPVVVGLLVLSLVVKPRPAEPGDVTYQAESLSVATSSNDPLSTSDRGATVRYGSNRPADYLTFYVVVPAATTYSIRLLVRSSRDSGQVQLSVKGTSVDHYNGSFEKHGDVQDLYSPVTRSHTLEVAEITFGSAGLKQFRLTVTGRNAASSGYAMGIDALTLRPSGHTAPPVAGHDTRSLRLHPFSSEAFSNVAMGSGATFAPESDPRQVSFNSGLPTINRSNWSISVQQATESDPVADVNGVRLRVPVDAVTTGGTDQHMSIIQPDGVTAYEGWGMRRVSSTRWTARYLVKTDLRGDGRAAGARASGISQLHGLIRKEELNDMSIKHTLAIGINNEKLKSVGGTGVWPSAREDGDAATAYKGPIPMGTMLAIPPSVDINALKLNPEGRALAVALQDYGAHVLVRADGVALFAELNSDEDEVRAMSRDWITLRSLLRVVTNNTADQVSGGGTRRQPPLPDGH